MNKILFSLLMCFSVSPLFSLYGENPTTIKDSIIYHFIQQELNLPQEKIYVCTDRESYMTGENILFKAYLLNANFHTPQSYSHYIYVELINASNRVIKRVKIRNINDIYEGYIPISETLPEGFYTIRAYTNFMRNASEHFFFRSFIYIKNSQAIHKRIIPEFNYTANGNIEVTLKFLDLLTDSVYMPSNLQLELNDKKISLRKGKDQRVHFTIKSDKESINRILYIEADDYRKYIFIPYSQEDFEIAFFPEGGHLLEDINTCIAFKAFNMQGTREEITGNIIDENGEMAASIQTSHQGMGLIYLTPRQGKRYYAICENSSGVKKSFELPLALGKGVSLKSSWVNDLLYIYPQSNNDALKNELFYLLLHTRGEIQYLEKWNPDNEFIAFNKAALSDGITQIVLLNEKGEIISEKVIFSKNEDSKLKTELSFNKKVFSSREKVNATFAIKGPRTNALNTNLSVKVRDINTLIPTINPSILPYLLLTSDLPEYTPDADSYFQKENQISKRALDMLMLTHSWKRHAVKDILKGDITEAQEAFEIGQEIRGEVKSLVRKRPVRNSEISILSVETSFGNKILSDENGRFSFNGFEFPDSTSYVIQALSEKGSELVELFIDEDQFPEVHLSIPSYVWEYENHINSYPYSHYEGYMDENGIRHIFMEEIEIKARYQEKQESIYSKLADQSFTLKDIEEMDATCMHELLRRIPGVRLEGEKVYIRTASSIYGDSKAALFIDGIYIDSDLDLDVVNMPDVQQVDVFKGGNTVIWGTIGANGVVSITTKKGNFTPPPKTQYNVKRITPLGYQRPIKFRNPQYEKKSSSQNSLPDLRKTIYWEPNPTSTNNKSTKPEFYTADTATEYELIIEGITEEGQIIQYKDTLKINQ